MCANAKLSGFSKNINNLSVVEHLPSINCRDKFLKAFLDKIIIVEMGHRNVMSVGAILDFLSKNYNVHVSPGTIYPILYKLEEKGHIEQLPNGGKKLYGVTDLGKEELENFLVEINEVRDFIADLIKININKKKYVELKHAVYSE